jgi:hypothetical protein
VQRCYYQPVTCYQTQTYYEPVVTYRTSYYYEPVVSYRYSCYYDPCTGCTSQVACPVTTYRLRSQCCAVQSWVARCCQVPVTTYRQACYLEPVTSCYTPCAPCCPTPCAPCCNGNGAAAAPAVTEQPSTAPPPPNVSEYRSTQPAQPYPGQPVQPNLGQPLPQKAPMEGSSYRQPYLPPTRPAAPAPPPTVRLDRIVALPEGPASIQGKVVSNNQSPRSGARVTFVSLNQQPERSITADAAGQFRVTLASGGWLVYVNGSHGKPIFHSKIDVQESDQRHLTLVSR